MNVKTRLVMHYWIPDSHLPEDQDYKLCEKIHHICLNEFLPNFDESIIVFTMDDYNEEVYNRYRKLFLDFGAKDITFRYRKNHPSRECITFKMEVVDKLKLLDGITFFLHNKGITNFDYNRQSIMHWIVSMYWYNLHNFDFPISETIGASRLCTGIFNYLHDEYTWSNYHWHYSGTFFWLNCQQIYDFIRRKNIELPCLNSRNDVENWIGDVIPRNRASSPMSYFEDNIDINPYDRAWDYIQQLSTPEDLANYSDFFNKVVGLLT